MYRVRIDIVNDVDIDRLIKISNPTRYVIVRHELPHGNPHFHAFIENDLKENTYRQRIKREFPTIKSTDYSIKKCDYQRVNEYVQYMFNTKHGNVWELYGSHNFDNQLLDGLIQDAKKVSDEFIETRSKPKSKGPTIWDIAQEVSALFDGTNAMEGNKLRYTGSGRAEDFPDDASNEKRMIRVYTEIAIHVLRKHRKAFDEFLLRKVISTAMASTEQGNEILVRKMYKNFCQLW